ncbi:MAG: type II/IV secretion system protein [Thermodesulfobacteriota bacterium]|nr:MAG: type II/IV secretion system protein [Thermodesulfobacteriota bacterium]
MNFEQILKERFQIKEEDLKKAHLLQKESSFSIGQILVSLGVLSEEQLIEALSLYLDIPILDNNFEIEEALKKNLNRKLNIKFLIEKKCVPIKIESETQTLCVATSDPFNYETFNYITNLTGFKIKLFLATEEKIKALSKAFIFEDTTEIKSLEIDEDVEKLTELAFEAPVIKYLNNLLNKAVDLRATDIHIENYKNKGRVRFRIDGILHDIEFLDENFTRAVISRIKLLSNLNIAERRLPQDGKFTTRVSSILLDIRVSTIPMVYGEGVVMRLLYRERLSFDIKALGMEKDHYDLALRLISYPYGILLVTGPTGSGKTTTLYSMLTYLNSDEKKIITIEDPVEYQLEGINQIQVKLEVGLTFANALRSILRHDPDIIMVGEIRDRETAEISIHSALTGHLVLSTLHTNDAPSSLFRLIEMGTEEYLINASIIGVIAQRIVRKNCPYCSEEISLDKEIRKTYGLDDLQKKWEDLIGEPKILKGRGCSKCVNTGYKGRIAIFEIFEYDDELKEAFLKLKSLESFRKYLKEKRNFRTLREDGFIKVLKGITTIPEILRVC